MPDQPVRPTPPASPTLDDAEDLLAFLDEPGDGTPPAPPPLPAPKLDFDIDLPAPGAETDLASELGALRQGSSAPHHEEPVVEAPDRHVPDFRVGLSEAELAAQLRPSALDHPVYTDLDALAGPRVEVGDQDEIVKVIEVNDTPEPAPPAPPRFLRLRGYKARLTGVWDGPLGWGGHEHPGSALVAAKVGLRVALFGILPVMLAVLIALPDIGGLYKASAADAANSHLLWDRGVVAFPAPDQLVSIGDGSQISNHLLDGLRSVYERAWSAIPAAAASGDASSLTGQLSGGALTTYSKQVLAVHDKGWAIELYGPGQFRDDLLFATAVPANDPTVITAAGGFLSIYITNANGDTVSWADYSGVEATFVRDSAGAWHVSTISFDPVPAP